MFLKAVSHISQRGTMPIRCVEGGDSAGPFKSPFHDEHIYRT